MAKPAEVLGIAYLMEPSGISNDIAPPAAPVLDLVHLSRQTFGDHALEKELLTLFDRQTAHFSARLAAPGVTGDAIWRAEIVHTLKGSARAVGAFRVGDAAEAYEAALREGGPGGARLKDELANSIAEARDAIAGLFEKA